MEWAAEFDVGEELARRLIAAQFPDVALTSIARFGAGMDNIAYIVDDKYVFRFPRRKIVVPLLEREERILPLIARHLPVPIPFPRYIGAPQFGYPWTFAGYERLQGTSACSASLSPEHRSALARPLGDFLRALHGLETALGKQAELPGDEIGRLDHNRRLPLAQERLAELESAGLVRERQRFLGFMRAHPPGASRDRRHIVHGDLYARHVLLDNNSRLCGIIDWGDVHVGDPALDLSIAHSLLPADAHAEFLAAYGPLDEETWLLAKYRAVYHSALVAHFGMRIHDAALRDAGLAGLQFIGETL